MSIIHSPQPESALQIASITDRGCVREHNEDSFAVMALDQAQGPIAEQLATHGAMFVVADGMGGTQAGDLASKSTVEALYDAYYSASPHEPVHNLEQAMHAANGHVYTMAYQQPHLRGMGSTCSALVLYEGTASIGHVGDSRIYHIRGDSIEQVTIDQTKVQRLVEQGELTPAEAAVHPERNILTQSMGVRPSINVEWRQIAIFPGDIFILCSDGLTGHVSDAEIFENVHDTTDLDAANTRLVALAKKRGGSDNITAVIVRVQSTNTISQQQFTTSPNRKPDVMLLSSPPLTNQQTQRVDMVLSEMLLEEDIEFIEDCQTNAWVDEHSKPALYEPDTLKDRRSVPKTAASTAKRHPQHPPVPSLLPTRGWRSEELDIDMLISDDEDPLADIRLFRAPTQRRWNTAFMVLLALITGIGIGYLLAFYGSPIALSNAKTIFEQLPKQVTTERATEPPPPLPKKNTFDQELAELEVTLGTHGIEAAQQYNRNITKLLPHTTKEVKKTLIKAFESTFELKDSERITQVRNASSTSSLDMIVAIALYQSIREKSVTGKVNTYFTDTAPAPTSFNRPLRRKKIPPSPKSKPVGKPTPKGPYNPEGIDKEPPVRANVNDDAAEQKKKQKSGIYKNKAKDSKVQESP